MGVLSSGSFDEFAVVEAGAGADEGDDVGCVDSAPVGLGGLDELEPGQRLRAWLGLFVGLLLSLFTAGAGVLPILIGLGSRVGSGLLRRRSDMPRPGQRDFVSHGQLVARRYDVLCQPRNAESGRNLLAALAMRTG